VLFGSLRRVVWRGEYGQVHGAVVSHSRGQRNVHILLYLGHGILNVQVPHELQILVCVRLVVGGGEQQESPVRDILELAGEAGQGGADGRVAVRREEQLADGVQRVTHVGEECQGHDGREGREGRHGGGSGLPI
jgi:hypothetical protein